MATETSFSILKNQGYQLSHGFLPAQDPIKKLPSDFLVWENCVHDLPKLFMTAHLRESILALPEFDISILKTPHEFERAMLILSYLSHAYVWHDTYKAKPADHLPAIIAKPWDAIAKHIGRPPVLSYASYALYNWYRIDSQKPIELGNIALLQNFLGGEDEEWFILVHVDIEAKAIPGLMEIQPAMLAAKNNNPAGLIDALSTIATSLDLMCNTLDRMPEHCDPYIYFNRVRPYIHGWKENPALPNGLIYEGVSKIPKLYKGETGAQSSIIPCFDALLGIKHAENPLKKHLDEMQNYMPPEHRAFLLYIQKNTLIREVMVKNKNNPTLCEVYNQCIKSIVRFRNTHIGYAARYIQKQSQVSTANPTQVGTGGTPFMAYLKTHLEETEGYML